MVILSLAGLSLVSFVPSNPNFQLLVYSSNGGSVELGHDVLLKGEPIKTLDEVRVFHGPLELRSVGHRVGFVLNSGSRVRFNRVRSDTPLVRMRVLNGSGTMAIQKGLGTVQVLGHDVTVQQGIFRWNLSKKRGLIKHSKKFRGDLSQVEAAQETTVDTFSGDKMFDRGQQNRLKKKEKWYVGSLMKGQKVKAAVSHYTSKNGRRPRSLRNVFGYWVRDRWGQVFLYRPSDSRYRIISAGPDQTFLTGDDRTWRGNWPD